LSYDLEENPFLFNVLEETAKSNGREAEQLLEDDAWNQ